MVKSILTSLASYGMCTVRLFADSATWDRTEDFVGSERSLPRMQRRGAVIILGMLALAKRSVVADRAEVLVKTGLGNLGKVRWHLISDVCRC